jgi:hypothetical protein
MAIVKIEALRSLLDVVELAVPPLRGRTRVVHTPPDEKIDYPKLVAIPASWTFRPEQAFEYIEPATDSLVECVGRWISTVQLRLVASTLFDRYALIEQINDLFLQREGAPGVLLTSVTKCESLGSFKAAWEFDDLGWDDEHAFSAQYWSIATISATVPALITRGATYMINDLRLGIADMDVTVNASTFNTSADVEVVRVNEDGTITSL